MKIDNVVLLHAIQRMELKPIELVGYWGSGGSAKHCQSATPIQVCWYWHFDSRHRLSHCFKYTNSFFYKRSSLSPSLALGKSILDEKRSREVGWRGDSRWNDLENDSKESFLDSVFLIFRIHACLMNFGRRELRRRLEIGRLRGLWRFLSCSQSTASCFGS